MSPQALLSPPKHQQLRDRLLAAIESGHYAPGQVFPTEAEIVAKENVSRNTVRHALADLEQRGLIERIRGKGTFVRGMVRAPHPQRLQDFVLVVTDVQSGFYTSLHKGFLDEAARADRQVVVCETNNDINVQANTFFGLMDRGVGGVALVSAGTGTPSAQASATHQIRQLQAAGVPVVLLHRPVDGVRAPLIALPYEEVGYLAARRLIEAGHRRLACCYGGRDVAMDRYRTGFHRALHEAGLPFENGHEFFNRYPILPFGPELLHELDGFLQQITDEPASSRPTAIWCSYDPLAELLIALLHDRGVAVPDDLSVLSFGGAWRGSVGSMRLDAVTVDEVKGGQAAAALLAEIADGRRSIHDDAHVPLDIGLHTGQTVRCLGDKRLPAVCRTLIGTCVTALAFAASVFAAVSAQGSEKDRWFDPPYFTTSQVMPSSVSSLPVFGRIEWSYAKLDFVADGPRGGISGAPLAHHSGAGGDALYLTGGFIPAGDESDEPSRRTSRWTHRYDLKSREWTRLDDMPGRREYTRSVVHNDSVYVLGGGSQRADPSGRFVASADCFRLDLSKPQPVWTIHSAFTVPRTHMAVGCVDNMLIVAGGNEYDHEAGGIAGSTIRDTTETLDLGESTPRWRQRAPIPSGPRGWSASAVCGGRLYVFGGLTYTRDGGRSRLAETLSYEPHADEWRQHTDFPIPISGWEAGTFSNRYVILAGGVITMPDRGKRGTTALGNDIVFVFDTEEGKWYRLEGAIPPGGRIQ